MQLSRIVKLGAFSSFAAATLLFAACSSDDGGSSGGGSDEAYVSAICKAGVKFSADLEKVLSSDITDEDKAIEAMVKPFENFANAIDDANPPKDLKDWHDQTVETLDDVVKKLKDGDVDALSSFGDSPLPEPPADASERLQKIADKNKDCQDADFAFGTGE